MIHDHRSGSCFLMGRAAAVTLGAAKLSHDVFEGRGQCMVAIVVVKEAVLVLVLDYSR
jgi:hypothetical protein